MNATRLAIVGVVAILAAVLLAWWTAPDHGPDVVAQAPAPAVAAAPQPATPNGARPAPRVPTSSGAIPPLPDRRPEPFPEMERLPAGEAHTADQPGLGLAAMERRTELVACWDEHLQSGTPGSGRFTLRLTLTDAGNDEGALAVDVPQVPDDPQLQACLNAAFADARFESPGEVSQSVVWPVPLAAPSGEP